MAQSLQPVVTEHALSPHPGALPPSGGLTVTAAVVAHAPGALRLEYRLQGDLAAVAVPSAAPSGRTERLWERTCFELFVGSQGHARYTELNFSPSTEWAAYSFDGYRLGMRPLALATSPALEVARSAHELRVTAAVDLGPRVKTPWPWRVGLTAVVLNSAGQASYWALRHPRAKPDFHDEAGWTVRITGFDS